MKNLLTLFIMLAFISGCSNGNDKITAKPAQDKSVRIVKLNVDREEEERLQKAADKGYQPWRNNPVDVAHAALVNGGANVAVKDCNLLSENGDEAVVAAKDKKGDYKVICKRVVKTGGIWTATEVEVAESENSGANEMTPEHMDHEHMGHEH
ncbi:MAG: hypothetical protein HY266_03610 [Deltaproteobacteria bacterium]|nr:hypothetical protein [Deltaproteobacteria bacterium]